ncbi:hypothetical protein RvY_05747 [Ramazzottius varieornatus]|uniref:Uncharacterized protein n=1 Tax=Ramazzottius varieornatus TaxID=947166 RepID=A0A1D1UZ42_RAMVA|nr:hypothetical protein RvY_05747 [Ramazzottius varieornatus]
MTKMSVAALCILVAVFGSAVNAAPVESDLGHQLSKRSSDMTSMLATLAQQFFSTAGQKGVNELQTASDKPSILQKYLGSALSGSNVSGLLSGTGDGQGGFIQMLIQKILSMFSGAAAGLTGTEAGSSPSVAGSAVGAFDASTGTGGKHSIAGDLLKAAAQQVMAPKA